MKDVINCRICGNELSGKQTLYCSTKCKNKVHQSYKSQKKRGYDRKIELINSLGGKCSICGYKKNISALTFHHKIPSQKQFQLDVRSLSNRTFSKIRNELKKCMVSKYI